MLHECAAGNGLVKDKHAVLARHRRCILTDSENYKFHIGALYCGVSYF